MDTNATELPFGIDLRRHLDRLVNDPSGLAEFRHWFSRAVWKAESEDDASEASSAASDDMLDLAHRIENLLAILDAGEWDRRQFIDAARIEMERFSRTPSPRNPAMI
jgi:hypothetical protein